MLLTLLGPGARGLEAEEGEGRLARAARAVAAAHAAGEGFQAAVDAALRGGAAGPGISHFLRTS